MHVKFAHTNSLSRHSAFLVFRSIDLNSAKSAPHVNSTPHGIFTRTYLHSCIYHARFRAFSVLTVNIVLAAYCSAVLNGILWPQPSLMSLMTASRICLYFCFENFLERLIMQVVIWGVGSGKWPNLSKSWTLDWGGKQISRFWLPYFFYVLWRQRWGKYWVSFGLQLGRVA